MVNVTVFVVPEALPSQRINLDPGAPLAVSVTDTALPKVSSQSPPQLIPAGLELTVPEPSPIFITFRSAAPAGLANKINVTRNITRPVVILWIAGLHVDNRMEINFIVFIGMDFY